MNFRSRGDGAAAAPVGDSPRPSYDAIGDRITSLLEAAEDAAEDIRKAAKQEAEDVRAEADRYNTEVRRRADAQAAEKSAEAEADAERIIRAAEERAERIEESAVERRRNLVAESQALQELLDDRRRWAQEMIGAFRDVTGRLEGVVEGGADGDPDAALHQEAVDGRGRSPGFVEPVEAAP